jgi:hypothetical protein
MICQARYELAPQEQSIFTFRRNPAKLNESEFSIYLLQSFTVVPMPDGKHKKVKTQKYSYIIERSDDQKEVIAFHWDADPTRTKVHYPHAHAEMIHIGKKCHVPTGRVPIEDVVWFAVKELGVQPLNKKWERVLADARNAFMLYKTW